SLQPSNGRAWARWRGEPRRPGARQGTAAKSVQPSPDGGLSLQHLPRARDQREGNGEEQGELQPSSLQEARRNRPRRLPPAHRTLGTRLRRTVFGYLIRVSGGAIQ